ncbi:hypothetical protein MC885_018622 [Smutsia gigantea]|nr:hypothetical protein MC885_018622 [Smutsia gigantea]
MGVLTHSLECAGAAHRVDILVFVRGSVRPLGPRGAKVGGYKPTKLCVILCWNKKTNSMVEKELKRKFVQKKPEKMMSR